MTEDNTTRILPRPPQPGFFRACPSCGAWFALQLLELQEKADDKPVKVYRCRVCGKEFEFGDRNPYVV